MKEIEFISKGKSKLLQLAESWEEVPKKQLPHFLELATRPQLERDKLLLFLKRMGVSSAFLRAHPLFMLREVAKCLAWLNDPWSDARSMIPRLWIFYGPKDFMDRLQLNQLLMAGIYSDKIAAMVEESQPTKKLKLELRRLAAILYTPFGMGYHYRFHHFYAFLFKVFPGWKINAVSISWMAQRKWLQQQFPKIHNQDQSSSSDFGPYGLVVDLAGDKFGTIEKVHSMEVIYVMTYLEKTEEQAEKLKAQK